MALFRVGAAPDSPFVFDEELKSWMRVGDAAQSDVESLFPVVVDYAESMTRRALLNQSWIQSYDNGFPYFCERRCGDPYEIRLPKPKLVSLTSFKYSDVDGVEQTLVENTDYELDALSDTARIRPLQSWPATKCMYHAVKIEFVCGYGETIEDIPAELMRAMRSDLIDLYENRQDVFINPINGFFTRPPAMRAVDRIYLKYRQWGV